MFFSRWVRKCGLNMRFFRVFAEDCPDCPLQILKQSFALEDDCGFVPGQPVAVGCGQVLARHDHDRQVRPARLTSQSVEKFPTIEPGHRQIQEDQVRPELFEQPQRFLAVPGRLHREVGLMKPDR